LNCYILVNLVFVVGMYEMYELFELCELITCQGLNCKIVEWVELCILESWQVVWYIEMHELNYFIWIDMHWIDLSIDNHCFKIATFKWICKMFDMKY